MSTSKKRPLSKIPPGTGGSSETKHDPIIYKRKHYEYLIMSETYKDAEKLCSSIKEEHHMHIRPVQLPTVVTHDVVVIVVCTPKTIFNHCKIMNSLIKSQRGKAVCVCILPQMNRRAIVETKQEMMAMMDEDHIVFALYDVLSKLPELVSLDKFWREVDAIIGLPQ